MEKDIILKVENISKQYRLGTIGTGTISHDLNRWWHTIRGKEDPYLKIGEINDRSTKGNSEYAWALKDINFEVERGEVLGIIGKNGAGKSTLLKILSKVTGPTTGEIKTKGRIASLLEVGTGFHPEMTGKENIFLNGAILGMTKTEIKAKLDEIIEFSGCERYIDTPVKRYSSGMTVRLAFAVAAFLEPDILVIDEVLAVGDAEFQKKAIGKMQDISKTDGRTVLFVSHNMAAVRSLCSSALLLKNGVILASGQTDKIVSIYLEDQTNKQNDILDSVLIEKLKQIGILVFNTSLNNCDNFSIENKTIFRIEYELLKQFENFNLSLVLNDVNDSAIFNSISKVSDVLPGRYVATFEIPENFLNNITYSIRILFVNNSKALVDLPNLVTWEAIETKERKVKWFGKFIGTTRPDFKWEIINI